MVAGSWIEFLIPITILMTAILNLLYVKSKAGIENMVLHGLATAFFGLIHGFGFSNYFKMLMAEEEDKLTPLLGFATGIELSQLLIVITVLTIAYMILSATKIKQTQFVVFTSILVAILTIPMLIRTFPM